MIINSRITPEQRALAESNHQSTKPGTRDRRVWRRMWLGLGGLAAATAVLFGVVAFGGTAHGQVNPLQIIPLAQGFSAKRHVNLRAQGPSDVLQSLLVFQPGGDTGWHIHPGPVVVVVNTGVLTEFKSNGCKVVHPAGSVFFETANEVHRALNQTAEVAEVYATFISPAGMQPLIPVPDPHPGSCRQDSDDHDDDR